MGSQDRQEVSKLDYSDSYQLHQTDGRAHRRPTENDWARSACSLLAAGVARALPIRGIDAGLNFLIAIVSQSMAVVSTANTAARISPRLISAESAAKMSKYSSRVAVERAKWNGDSAIGLI